MGEGGEIGNSHKIKYSQVIVAGQCCCYSLNWFSVLFFPPVGFCLYPSQPCFILVKQAPWSRQQGTLLAFLSRAHTLVGEKLDPLSEKNPWSTKAGSHLGKWGLSLAEMPKASSMILMAWKEPDSWRGQARDVLGTICIHRWPRIWRKDIHLRV